MTQSRYGVIIFLMKIIKHKVLIDLNSKFKTFLNKQV
jgi:hypothetical protein